MGKVYTMCLVFLLLAMRFTYSAVNRHVFTPSEDSSCLTWQDELLQIHIHKLASKSCCGKYLITSQRLQMSQPQIRLNTVQNHIYTQ